MAGGVIMNKNQKNYKIILKTNAPLHIGSGKSIGKKEYILTGNEQAKIINLEKLAMLIAKKKLFSKYEYYMCEDKFSALGEWLTKNGISKSEIDSITDYTLNCRNAEISGKREIKTFIKNPYGEPYIPGSSMKGCLRTILMGYYTENKPEQYAETKNKISHSDLKGSPKWILKDEDNQLEYTTYYTANRKNDKPKDKTNAVNDIMAGIIVGDSEPIKTDRLILCQKCDLRTDNEYVNQSVFNECIAPETIITLPLTINSSLCNITADEIKEAVKQFTKSYYQNFISNFDLPRYSNDYTLWLGGNVGFASKTVIYNLFGKTEGVQQASRILTAQGHYKNQHDRALKVSPHTISIARYNGNDYHMGECTITIKEV